MLSAGCVGFMALQGCAGPEYTGDAEDLGSEQSAVGAPICYSNTGVHTTKAALAVAMATELGRWDPLNDLVLINYKVALKPGISCVRNSCKQTKAILGQMDFTPNQATFSSEGFRNDLYASLERQKNLIADLTRNRPSQLPPAHKLTPVGSMTLSGACGAHFIFQVDNVNGSAMTSAQAALMSNTLCYFGQNTAGTACGSNPFIGFTQTQTGCPAGRVCVAIDPDPYDTGSGSSTVAGSAPTYTLNRLYDPGNTMLNTACTRTTGVLGSMVSKCAATPNTCGYLYCM
jgi:hypothetical protein